MIPVSYASSGCGYEYPSYSAPVYINNNYHPPVSPFEGYNRERYGYGGAVPFRSRVYVG